jgi:hypothetical protein
MEPEEMGVAVVQPVHFHCNEYMNATIQELLEAVFSVQSMPSLYSGDQT